MSVGYKHEKTMGYKFKENARGKIVLIALKNFLNLLDFAIVLLSQSSVLFTMF